MFLHTSHAALRGSNTILLRSPDTDVAVTYQQFAARLIFQTGFKQRQHFINLSGIGTKLGQIICEALIGYHAFSDYDSVSAFVDQGKGKGLKMVKYFETFRNTMGRIGRAAKIDDHFIQDFEAAICCLCGHHGDTEINKLRFSLFGSKTTDL